MASEKKIAEAQECVRQAEKCLKTSFFKFQPDYDGAASEYAKAATHYKNAKSLQQCKECLIKAAECHRNHRAFFSAAKSLDQAALVTKDLGDLLEAASLIERACQMFREHGAPDTAAMTLEKGAKMLEGQYPAKALEFYQRASEVVMLEERPRNAAEYVSKSARILVKLARYDEAADAIRKEIDLHLACESRGAAGRMVVALVLVELARGDLVAAQKALQEGLTYLEEEELNTLANLLEAWDQQDWDTSYRYLNNPFIKHMDVEYAKLARGLVQPKSKAPASSLPLEGDALADDVDKLQLQDGAAGKPVRTALDDEDFAGGLC